MGLDKPRSSHGFRTQPTRFWVFGSGHLIFCSVKMYTISKRSLLENCDLFVLLQPSPGLPCLISSLSLLQSLLLLCQEVKRILFLPWKHISSLFVVLFETLYRQAILDRISSPSPVLSLHKLHWFGMHINSVKWVWITPALICLKITHLPHSSSQWRKM